MAQITYGSITVSDLTDGKNANIWTTTVAPTTPDYTFNISNLTGSNDDPREGDIILYDVYRYTISSVDVTTVLAGNRQSLQGEPGTPGSPGAPGSPGTPGASVTKIVTEYYKKRAGGQAPQPSTTGSTTIPEYESGCTYYTRTVTYLSVGDPVKGDWLEATTLTNQIKNAYDAWIAAGAAEIKLKQFFPDTYGLIVTGEADAEVDQPSTYGYNTIMAPNYLGLRYNAINLAKLTTTESTPELQFYFPKFSGSSNTPTQGDKGLTLGVDGMSFYHPGDSSNADVTLNSSGLTITNGAIQFGSGGSSGTSAGNIRLANVDFSRNINGTSRNYLRLAIGNKFGVKNDGTLYASNVDISGNITATGGKIAGWTIAGQKIYAGDGSTIKTAVMQAPSSSVTWVFAAGGSSHDSYNDCPFRVDKTGALYATSGVIGGWNINVSHIYKYTAAATTVYDNNKTEEQNLTSGAIQYGAFMQAVNGTPTPDQGAFYVGYRKCTTISNNTPTYSSWIYPFVVHYDGTITANRGQIAGWTINTSGFFKKTNGDNDGSKFAALYASNIGSTTNHVLTFAERSSGAWDYKTYVRGDGYLYSKYGQIGTWKVSPTGATTTHCYNGNLYGQATDGTYDYEVGMKADGNPTNTNVDSSSYLAFYISKVAHGADWNSTNRTNVFYINQGGKLYASNAEIEGKITATSGSIAGWTITGSCIEKDNTEDTNGTRCGIQNSNTYSPTRAVFYAGTKTAAGGYIANETDSNFYVRQDGYMYCAEAKVAGTIIANAGTIGGWNIGTDSNKSLYYGSQTPGATTTNLVLSPTSATNTNAIAGSGTGKTWFISAGQKFGVDTSGTLYASGATINGNTTIAGNTTITGNATIDSSVTIGGKNQSEYLNDNINVGGRNLLRGTASVVIGSGQTEGSWSNAKFYKSDSTDGTVESVSYSNPLNLATVIKATAGSTINANIGIAQSAVPIAKTTVTLSAWVKGTAGDTVRLQPCYVESDGGKPESGYKDFTIADGNWHRYEYTKTLAYDHLDGSVRAGFVYGRTATAGRVFYICGVKLEYGNKATDWAQAPEDENGINLVPWPYYRDAVSGSPYTSNGVTWTLNADGSVTAKGTATANSWYHCAANYDPTNVNGAYCIPAGTYTVTGCPAGGSSSTYYININLYDSTTGATSVGSYNDYGSGNTFSITTQKYVRIQIGIMSGMACPSAGYTFYPMLENGGVAHKFVSPKLNEGAASTASKYITRIDDNGIRIHPASNINNSVVVDGTSMRVYKDGTADINCVAEYGDTVRIGKIANNYARTLINTGGMQIVQRSSSGTDITMANIGYGSGNAEIGTSTTPYFTFGQRASGSSIGNYSIAEGNNVTASAIGSHAEGKNTIASGQYSHAGGYSSTATAYAGFAHGYGVKTQNGFAIGQYNAGTSARFSVGIGTSDTARADAFSIRTDGYVISAGPYYVGDFSSPNKLITTGTVEKTGSAISGGSYGEVTVSATKTGYTPIGIIGYKITGTNVQNIVPYQMYLNGTTAIAKLRNVGSNSYTPTVTFYVLYIAVEQGI